MKRTVALLVFGAVASSQALMIDSFTGGSLDLNLSFPATFASGTRTDVSILGGSAFHTFAIASNPDGNSGRHRVNTVPQVLSVSGQDGVASTSYLTYGMTSDLDLDLSTQDRLRVHFRSVDQVLTAYVNVYTRVGSTYEGAGSGVAVLPGSDFDKDFLFADFSPNLDVDLANIDRIEFGFSTQPSGDFSVYELTTVPEPASIAALGLGAVALLRRRRSW